MSLVDKMTCQALRLTPWIEAHYPRMDEEAFANGGQAEMVLHCTVCNYKETVTFWLPPTDDPKWKELLRDGDPALLAERGAFQFSHLHDRQAVR